MNSVEYIKVLEEANINLIREFGYIFVHDNALIHRSQSVQRFIEHHDIPVEDWPQYSPDLNLSLIHI